MRFCTAASFFSRSIVLGPMPLIAKKVVPPGERPLTGPGVRDAFGKYRTNAGKEDERVRRGSGEEQKGVPAVIGRDGCERGPGASAPTFRRTTSPGDPTGAVTANQKRKGTPWRKRARTA